MRAPDHGAAGQISDGARHTHASHLSARGKPKPGCRHFKQRRGLCFQPKLQLGKACFRIIRRTIGAITRALCGACCLHTRGHGGAGLTRWGAGQFSGRDRHDFDGDIHAIQQRAGKAHLIILSTARRAATFAPRLPQIAAAAGVHRRNALKPRWVSHMRMHAADGGAPGFHGLTQSLKRLAREFGPFIQKQNAAMRQADFARLGARTTTNQRRHGSGMMRLPEWRARHQAPALQQPGDGMHQAHFQCLGRRKIRQQRG